MTPEERLDHLATLAKIPAKKREGFKTRIANVIEICCRAGANWQAPSIGDFSETVAAISAVRKLAEQLRGAIEALDGRAVWAIENFDPNNFDDPHCPARRIADYRDLAADLARAAEAAEGLGFPKPPSRGRRKREPGNPGFNAFDLLLWSSLSAVKAEGGKLTFDKNLCSGTMPEFIEHIRPELPNGVVPNVLPVSRLQHALTNWTKKPSSPT